MNFLINFFRTTLTEPLFNLLIIFYLYLPGQNLGVAIICLTLLIRILLYPLQAKASRSQLAIQALQPKIKEIQKKYKKDRAKQGMEMMELYKKEKINPFSGFLVLLVQFPVLIALYRLFWRGITKDYFGYLYSFVSRPDVINTNFLGIDLNKPSIALAIFAGVIFFLQAKTSSPKTVPHKEKSRKQDFTQMLQKQTQYFFPVLMVVILLKLPSAVGLYLLTGGLFTTIQQYFIKKKYYSLKEGHNV